MVAGLVGPWSKIAGVLTFGKEVKLMKEEACCR